MKYIVAAALVYSVLVSFARFVQIEAADQEEREAYTVWQGQCRRGEVLCIVRKPPMCDTDSDCMAKFGNDGGPGN